MLCKYCEADSVLQNVILSPLSCKSYMIFTQYCTKCVTFFENSFSKFEVCCLCQTNNNSKYKLNEYRINVCDECFNFMKIKSGLKAQYTEFIEMDETNG